MGKQRFNSGLLKMAYNKFAKFASFAVLTARDAFTTRPLQRRYMRLFIFCFFVIVSIPSIAQTHADEVSRQIRKWNQIVREELPRNVYENELIEWGNEKGLSFKYVENSSLEIDKNEFEATIGTFESIDIDCDFYTIYASIQLNKFGQTTGGYSVGRKGIECAKGI